MDDHRRSGVLLWVLLALAGLAVAVALSVAASNLSTQPIGLSGEPLRAGDKLAPAGVPGRTTATVAQPRPKKPQSTSTFTTPTTQSRGAPEPPAEDRGGVDTDHDDD